MRRYLLSFLATIALFGFSLIAMRAYLHRPLDVSEETTVQIGLSHGLSHLLKSVSDKQLLEHPLVAKIALHIAYGGDALHAGEYRISPGDSFSSLMSRILAGDVLRRRFLMIEGWTIQQVLDKLAKDPTITQTLQGVSSAHLLEALGLPAGPAEGLFFPDTYFYHRGVSDKRLLLMSYRMMQDALSKAWENRSKKLSYATSYKALIAASLIEKETANSSERLLIAAVINNRLKAGMRLQIDPTVIYGAGVPYGAPLTHAMLRKKTPFNTYRHAGLPPTPIALPSRASIEAACHPAKSHALYYVAQGNGKHRFSSNYHQHLKGVLALRHHQLIERRKESIIASWRSFMCLSMVVAETLVKVHPFLPLSRWLCDQKEALWPALWYH